MWVTYCCFCFFSSRRRHTRLQGDWSSDVCSSDLSRHLPRRHRRGGSRGPPLCRPRSEEHTSELQSPCNLVCRLLLEKKKNTNIKPAKEMQTEAKSEWTWMLSCVRGTIMSPRTACSSCSPSSLLFFFFFFFFNDTATTEIYTLSLHDALPISHQGNQQADVVLGKPNFSTP